MAPVFISTPEKTVKVKEAHVAAMDKAKIALMSSKDSAFFVSLCFSMRHKWDSNIPTACTDGTSCRYNPIFFLGLTLKERIFIILHETMHVAYEHMGRLLGKNMLIWNFACDHVINLQLIARGFQMPKGGLADERFKGMAADHVYAILLRERAQQGNPQPSQAEKDLQDLEPLPSHVDPERFSQEVKDILIRAKLRSKQEDDSPGVIPGEIDILLEKLLAPKLNWKVILRRWLQTYDKSDYSWRKLNRRYWPAWMLPGLYGSTLVDMTVALDTSGSVSDSDFQTMVSELAGVFRICKPKEITLIQFDTQIKSITKIRSIADLKACKFTGRGGTRVQPVLEWANQHKPQLLMFLTDGGFYAPPEQYDANKTLWLIHNNPNFTSQYGKVVHYEIPQ